MFDDQPSSPNNTSLPNTAAPPAFKEKKAETSPKPAEDIFSKTDTLPANQLDQISPEPEIKATPSIFTPKASAEEIPFEATMPGAVPAMPKPKAGKNIILLISLFLIIVIAGAAAWWFFMRDKSEPDTTGEDINPAVIDFYKQTQENPESPDKTPPPTSTPLPQEKDTDSDGLTDEEETILGTSLNSPDTDGDQLFDREEVKVYNTDPLKSDTDDDGVDDKQEVMVGTDPLVADDSSLYTSQDSKFSLQLPDGMILESSQSKVVQFNNNIDQIKLYIYINNNLASTLTPDTSYTISENNKSQLIVNNKQDHPDQTPYATDLSTNYYSSSNGHSYIIRYIATKKASDHQQKFEQILQSFEFLK